MIPIPLTSKEEEMADLLDLAISKIKDNRRKKKERIAKEKARIEKENKLSIARRIQRMKDAKKRQEKLNKEIAKEKKAKDEKLKKEKECLADARNRNLSYRDTLDEEGLELKWVRNPKDTYGQVHPRRTDMGHGNPVFRLEELTKRYGTEFRRDVERAVDSKKYREDVISHRSKYKYQRLDLTLLLDDLETEYIKKHL
ncbi:MAG: hypothetical protein KUG81_02575 [Gammaproteobacteria bacterium]|nr:hypothetical protein [Gammaproteobacteria bacterium]